VLIVNELCILCEQFGESFAGSDCTLPASFVPLASLPLKTLLLWDIDGTILSAKGAGRAALSESLAKSFGISSDLAHIDMYGRTDRWIYRQMLQSFHLELSEVNFKKLEDHYFEALPAQLGAKGIGLLPGVPEVIEEGFRRGDIMQGLLTGNLRRGAELKLTPYGLWEKLKVGAFADDSEDRNQLPPHALRRASELAGHDFRPEQVWIIGDTPHDIACGHHNGLRTLAVATGKHTMEQLAAEKPCALLSSLADSKSFWTAIEA